MLGIQGIQRRWPWHVRLRNRFFPGTPYLQTPLTKVILIIDTPDSKWRNRSEFLEGREAIKAFLTKKWKKEKEYCLMKELWGYHGNRISARFEYEWVDNSGKSGSGHDPWLPFYLPIVPEPIVSAFGYGVGVRPMVA